MKNYSISLKERAEFTHSDLNLVIDNQERERAVGLLKETITSGKSLSRRFELLDQSQLCSAFFMMYRLEFINVGNVQNRPFNWPPKSFHEGQLASSVYSRVL